MQAGLLVGGKDTKEGRQTVCFTSLDCQVDELDEEYEDFFFKKKNTKST